MQKREELKAQALESYNYDRLKKKEKVNKAKEQITEADVQPITHKTAKSRRERRQEARQNGEEFQPMYNITTKFDPEEGLFTAGGEPKTHEEMFGVGYERFNSKYVTIKEEKE
jgi:hypothetical protein